MFEQWKYRVKLHKLFKQKEMNRVAYDDQIQKARRDNASREDIEGLKLDCLQKEFRIEDEIAILVTDNLIQMASRHFVPVPSRKSEGMWGNCVTFDQRVLTNNGISQLRSSLRKEFNERRKAFYERVELVVKVLAVLIGIIGAITGLIAVIVK